MNVVRFVIELTEASHRVEHPAGQIEYRVRVQFPWMRAPDCAVKLEITTDEPVLTSRFELAIQHAFDEPVAGMLKGYSLEEVIAEKLRALLQKRQQLETKGWMSNRARDVYDLWFLKNQTERPLDWDLVASILPDKAAARDVTFVAEHDFVDDRVMRYLRRNCGHSDC